MGTRHNYRVENIALIGRLEWVDALNSAALARALQNQDPSWGAQTLPVAGGQLVLCGPGLYVNRAIATGITEPLQSSDIDLIVEHSSIVGVAPEIEVTPAMSPESRAALAAHGFHPELDEATSVHVYPLDRLSPPSSHPAIQVVPVSDSTLEQWQEISAAGWGHNTQDSRRAADSFARAASAVDGDGMILAFDSNDARPLGCASLTINGDVATLGGMSTLPAERRHGVQTALIIYRLGAARQAGCTIAMSTTTVGGASERNLLRFGFHTTHIKQIYTQQPSQI